MSFVTYRALSRSLNGQISLKLNMSINPYTAGGKTYKVVHYVSLTIEKAVSYGPTWGNGLSITHTVWLTFLAGVL